MSQTQLTKIISELKKTNEKLMILALMQVPSLKPDSDYIGEDLRALSQLISANVLSNNPDVSYLSRKAANHMQDKFQLTPVDENVILGDSTEDSDEFITIDESFSQDPLTLEKQLLALPDNFQDHDNILPFLMHSNNRIIATTIETLARTSYPKQDLIAECTPFLDSDHNRIKANAIIAIGKLDFNLVNEQLCAMFQTTKISMRESAVYAISKLETSISLQRLLLKCLHDPYLDIRLRAIDILKRYNHPDVVTQMKRLANDLDIEICEAALETIQILQNSKEQTVVEPPQEVQPPAPFEHIQTLEEQQDTVDLDDFDSEQDDFFNSHEEESIHIENDFISIENNELDEFIIPSKPSESLQKPPLTENDEDIQPTLTEFETSIDDFDTFEPSDPPENSQESIALNEPDEIIENELLDQDSLSSSSELDAEFDLFALEDSEPTKVNNSESIDLFAMDEIAPIVPEVILESDSIIVETPIDDLENNPDFDVFGDLEASDSFSSEKSSSTFEPQEQAPTQNPVQSDFDLFDFNEPPLEDTPVLQEETITPSSEPMDDFPDFEDSEPIVSSPEVIKQPIEPEAPIKPKVDEFEDFPDFDEQISNSNQDVPKQSHEVEALEQFEQKNETTSDTDFVEPQIIQECIPKTPQLTAETLKSLQYLDEIHQKIFQNNKSIPLKDEDYFESIRLNVSANLFDNYNDKDLASSDVDWLPHVVVKTKVIPPKVIPTNKSVSTKEKLVNDTKKIEVPPSKPSNKDLISAKISAVLKEVGNECYQLCQEYDPENEDINLIYNTILKIQSHLDAMIKGKIKATPKLNLNIIKRKLDQTFEKLGRITLKEINGKRFILHNSERFQKQIRSLVKQLNS